MSKIFLKIYKLNFGSLIDEAFRKLSNFKFLTWVNMETLDFNISLFNNSSVNTNFDLRQSNRLSKVP